MIKRKHLAAMVFAAATLPLGLSGFHVLRTLHDLGYTQAAANPLVRPVNIPGPGVVREIVRLGGRMDTLNAKPAFHPQQVDLTLFGYEPLRHADGSHDIRGSTGHEHPDDQITHTVTLAFAGEKKGFCVIDGRFYPAGGTLPDGAKIVKVEAQRVLIHKFNLKRWIPVSDKRG